MKILVALVLILITSSALQGQSGINPFSPLVLASDADNECVITGSEIFSLVTSINHARNNFLNLRETTIGQMWWGATLGLNESLKEPLTREDLENRILELRVSRPIHPKVSLYFRMLEVQNETNAKDFLYLLSNFCEAGLLEADSGYGDHVLERAHQSLGDAHSSYMNAVEAEEYRSELLSTKAFDAESVAVFRSHKLTENVYVLEISSLIRRSVAGDVRETLEAIVSTCPSPHIIIDLRNNRGGFHETSIGVLGNFLPGYTVAQLEYRDGTRTSVATKERDSPFHFRSITVLVNENTASGAEVISAALSENGAVTVGDKTYGKGVGQILGLLQNGGISRITQFRVYSPSGDSWHGKGITPDTQMNALPFALASDEMRAELERNLRELISDEGIVTAYRSFREGEMGHLDCYE